MWTQQSQPSNMDYSHGGTHQHNGHGTNGHTIHHHATMPNTHTSMNNSLNSHSSMNTYTHMQPGNQQSWFSDPPAVPNFVQSSGINSLNSQVLTPTTLANIEQTFIELQSVPVTSATGNQLQDHSRQSGFVPPIVEPLSASSSIKDEYDYYDSSSMDDDDSKDWMPSSGKRSKGNNGTGNAMVITPISVDQNQPKRKSGRRPNKYANMSPEEEERRRVRRERNKLAAAKCRQRRVDHTNTLINETEQLEETKASLESDIQTLQQQKEQLEFLLEAHKPMCGKKHEIGGVAIKSEPVEDSVAQATVGAIATIITTSASTSRPNTLPLEAKVATTAASMPIESLTKATGIVISTPSTGVFATLGLDSMVDGHTGLTPITGGPSCSSQAQRNSSDSSPNESLASPTRLMAL